MKPSYTSLLYKHSYKSARSTGWPADSTRSEQVRQPGQLMKGSQKWYRNKNKTLVLCRFRRKRLNLILISEKTTFTACFYVIPLACEEALSLKFRGSAYNMSPTETRPTRIFSRNSRKEWRITENEMSRNRGVSRASLTCETAQKIRAV